MAFPQPYLAMRTYIARGGNQWYAATTIESAVLRLIGQGVKPSQITVCSTSGKASVQWDGTITSTEEIEQHEVALIDLVEWMMTATSNVHEALRALVQDEVLTAKDTRRAEVAAEELSDVLGRLSIDHPLMESEATIVMPIKKEATR